MNDKLSKTSVEFREAATALIVPIQTTRVINEAAFENLHKQAKELCRLLKGQELVSKSLLKEFYAIMQILRAEAPYHGKSQATLTGMADKIEYCFGLILEGEAPEDRTPGVPRIF